MNEWSKDRSNNLPSDHLAPDRVGIVKIGQGFEVPERIEKHRCADHRQREKPAWLEAEIKQRERERTLLAKF